MINPLKLNRLMFGFRRLWQYYAGILLLFPFATFISGCDLRNDSGKTKLNVVEETQIGSTKVKDFVSDEFQTGDIVFQDNGINLGELHPVKHYNIKGMESYLKKRGISPDQLVIAPSDLIDQSESVK